MLSSDDPVTLIKVEVQQLADALNSPRVVSLIEQAMLRNGGKRRFEDVFVALREARQQLWVMAAGSDILGVTMTEIVVYPQKKICRVTECVGRERERWQHLLAGIEDWARQIKCDGVELIARPGWSRVLEGYDMTHVVLEKEF